MPIPTRCLALLPLFVFVVVADFLGPTYPAPTDLTSDGSLVPTAWRNFTSTLDGYLKSYQSAPSAILTGAENVTFSVGMFSIQDAAVSDLQYHYTSPEILNAPTGTHQVDGDSIYRVASVSKLVTVFVGMVELSDEDWKRYITDFLPGLAESAHDAAGKDNVTYTVQWDKVTLWSLAAQLAGVPQVGIPAGDLLYQYAAAAAVDPQLAIDPLTTYGAPSLELEVLGPCSSLSELICSDEAFIESLRMQPPTFLPWTSPAYSDAGFMLLGLAYANITGKPIDALYRDSVLSPLGMESSSLGVPKGEAELTRSVISGDPATNYLLEGGFTNPSGGVFSTINDLARLGTGILNSTLLSAEATRKWLKPITHTASLTYSVGAPWEIYRYIHPSTGKVTDLYTKLGDSGLYGGILVLIPDYNTGFSLLAASNNTATRSGATGHILDLLSENILPALEAQAAAEAAHNIVGTYASTDPALNSSLTVSLNESTVVGGDPLTALCITTWISNGTDALASLFPGVKPRLLPTIPNQRLGEAGQIAFQASIRPQTNSYTTAGDLAQGPFSGFYATNFDWLTVDLTHYGGVSTNLFVFDVDERGKAVSVRPAVARATLKRQE